MGHQLSDRTVVKRYLQSVRDSEGARRLNPDVLQKRLARVEAHLAASPSNPTVELALLERRRKLQRDIATTSAADTSAELTNDFIAVAERFGRRHGIVWAVWRQVGVPAGVLRSAGISRASTPQIPAEDVTT